MSTLDRTVSGDATAPSVPNMLPPVVVSSTQVNLAWLASADNVLVTGYRVYVNAVFKTGVVSLNAPVSGLSPSTTYMLGVTAVDAVGNESAPGIVFATTQPAVVVGGIKDNGGHYSWKGSQGWLPRGNTMAAQKADAALQIAGTGWSGCKVSGYQAFYEADTAGSYTTAISTINSALATFAGVNPPQRLMLQLQDRIFGTPNGVVPSDGSHYPTYMSSSGMVEAATVGSGNAVQSTLNWWQSATMDRIIALWTALATPFDSHPLIEMICPMEETAFDPTGGYSYTTSAAITQIKRLMSALSPLWPHTKIRFLVNFIGADSDITGVYDFAAALPIRNICFGGPDPEIPAGTAAAPSTTYPIVGPPPGNYPTKFKTIQGPYLFRGLRSGGSGPGSAPNGTDYRTKLVWVGEVQQYGIADPTRSESTPAQIIGFQVGNQNARYMCWDTATGVGSVTTAINAYVASQASVPAFGLATTLLSASAAFDLYISPTGVDTNAGTLAAPWSIAAINTKRATYAGKRLGIIGDQGSYPNCYTACGSPNLAGRYTFALLQVAEGTTASPTVVQSCTSSGAPAGPHIPGTTAALLIGGLNDTNNGGSNTGSALIGHNGSIGNVQIYGLEITGCNSFGIGCGSWGTTHTPGLIVRYNYVHGMSTALGTGANPTAITFRGAGGKWIGLADSYVADNFVTNCIDTGAHRFSAIELWQSAGCSVKYNSVVTAGSGDLSGGINIKNVGCYANKTYNNYVDLSTGAAASIGNLAFDADNSGPSPPYSFYAQNNILICPPGYSGCYWGLAGVNASASAELQNFINNTVIGSATVWFRNGAASTFTSYNNIVTALSSGGYGVVLLTNNAPKKMDANCYPATFSAHTVAPGTNGSGGNATFASIAAWRAQFAVSSPSCIGQEAHSIQHVPVFQGGATYAGKYKLQAGDLCLTSGLSDGTVSGTPMQQGAWGGVDIDSGGPITQIGASWLQI